LSVMETSRCAAFASVYRDSHLYIAFDGDVDRGLMSAVASALGRRAEPCIVGSRQIESHLEWRRKQSGTPEAEFANPLAMSEMKRIVLSYATQMQAESVNLGCTRHYIWVRVAATRSMDLLFRSCARP